VNHRDDRQDVMVIKRPWKRCRQQTRAALTTSWGDNQQKLCGVVVDDEEEEEEEEEEDGDDDDDDDDNDASPALSVAVLCSVRGRRLMSRRTRATPPYGWRDSNNESSVNLGES
jgi:hypothetical protein